MQAAHHSVARKTNLRNSDLHKVRAEVTTMHQIILELQILKAVDKIIRKITLRVTVKITSATVRAWDKMAGHFVAVVRSPSVRHAR